MIILLSALLTLQTAMDERDDFTASIERLRTCVDQAVIRLVPSGEAADIIADAAKTTCDTERTAVLDGAVRQAPSPESGARIAGPIMAGLDEEVRARAVLQVTQIRATHRRP